jgi:serine/threonine protein phosphatase PrpC
MLRVADYFEKTDTGRERRANEDAHFTQSPLFVVADGMGGARAGEVASGIVVEVFKTGMPDAAEPDQGLTDLIREANGRIHDMATRDAQRAGMGTTVTAAYVADTGVAIAHVGDSRAYRWRGGELERLTDDHSLVAELMRRGKITEAEAETHPQRSVITRALGPEADVDVDVLNHPARAGDVFLLCSDGLTSMVPEARITEVLAGCETLAEMGRALINEANERGGRDNITVVLFSLEEVGAAAGGSTEAATVIEPGAGHEVREAVAAEPATATQAAAGTPPAAPPRTAPLPPRRPREPGTAAASSRPRRRGRFRRLGPAVAVLVVLAIIGAGAWIATQSVYFVGTDNDGFVTVFQGLPYDLPAGINLYDDSYISGVPADELTPAARKKLLDHQLRSKSDASDLVRKIELGQLDTAAIGGTGTTGATGATR